MSEIDLFHPDFFANPYPTYTRLREEQPVYWDERAQRWFIMRYADVVAATIHPGVSGGRGTRPASSRAPRRSSGVCMGPVQGPRVRQRTGSTQQRKPIS